MVRKIEADKATRVGLLATQGNPRSAPIRRVLAAHHGHTGEHFCLAWSDHPWILEGAAVHISIVWV